MMNLRAVCLVRAIVDVVDDRVDERSVVLWCRGGVDVAEDDVKR